MSYPIVNMLGIALVTVVSVISVSGALAASDSAPETTASFLLNAADHQQSEIALGQLAVHKAATQQVKEFGARMVANHQKAQQEVQQLARKGGLQLPTQPNESHTKLKHHLEKLSGQEFDREYITTMLREHAKEMEALEEQALVEKNPEIQQWAAGEVPVIQEHLAKAKTIASSLGMRSQYSNE